MRRTLFMLAMAIIGGTSAYCNEENGPEKIHNNIIFIEEGATWEVEVKSNIDPDAPVMNVTQRLEGEKIINDQVYYNLWLTVDGGERELISYIRIEKPKLRIYAVSPDDPDCKERLIYTFGRSQNDPDPLLLTAMNWDGTLSEDEYEFKYEAGEYIGYGDFPYKYWYAYTSYYPTDTNFEGNECLGTATWIFGIGSTAGFASPAYPLNKDYTSRLKRVVTDCTGVVWEEQYNSVDNIKYDVAPDGMKYRPDGTRFTDGEKGLYIFNGKKYIAR